MNAEHITAHLACRRPEVELGGYIEQLPPVPEELLSLEGVGQGVQYPGVEQPEEARDKHEGEGVPCNLQGVWRGKVGGKCKVPTASLGKLSQSS